MGFILATGSASGRAAILLTVGSCPSEVANLILSLEILGSQAFARNRSKAPAYVRFQLSGPAWTRGH